MHTDGTVTDSSNLLPVTNNTSSDVVSLPSISAKDYTDDVEFSGMYQYLFDGTLSGTAKKDKPILLVEDKYIIDNDDLLYRVDTRRQKNLAQLKPTTKRLCVPLKFRHDIISYVHNNCGHYAAQSLFHTLAARYFWKSMFADGVEYCRTCDTCQRTKLNYGHRYAPLHPLSVPEKIGTRFSMDHKVLTRTTSAGNTAVLVIAECFSGFPHLIPVPDQTADTTAKAIVKHIVPFWGIHFSLYSDKALSFMSALFAHVNAMLGIRHVTSASRTARSNGQAEALVKRLSEHLKFYAKDDYSIKEVIPIIEVNLRATPHSKLLISPYEIVFGRPMRIGIPSDPRTTPPATEQSADVQGPHPATTAARTGSAPINAEPRAPQSGRTEPTTDPTSYYRWLSTELKRVHDAVKVGRENIKVADKLKYDKANKVVEPTWKVGDQVLLQDNTVKSGSSHIITRPRFVGPYTITDIVTGCPDVGPAYRLVDMNSGKALRHLVSNDRLKRYDANRQNFNRRLPSVQVTARPQTTFIPTVVGPRQRRPQTPKPIEILSDKKIAGKRHYRVKYTDGQIYDCDWVNRPLLDHYQAKQRFRRL